MRTAKTKKTTAAKGRAKSKPTAEILQRNKAGYLACYESGFVPYGPEWAREMMKLSKMKIIELLKEVQVEKQKALADAKDQLWKAKDEANQYKEQLFDLELKEKNKTCAPLPSLSAANGEARVTGPAPLTEKEVAVFIDKLLHQDDTVIVTSLGMIAKDVVNYMSQSAEVAVQKSHDKRTAFDSTLKVLSSFR